MFGVVCNIPQGGLGDEVLSWINLPIFKNIGCVDVAQAALGHRALHLDTEQYVQYKTYFLALLLIIIIIIVAQICGQ